jgi:hypothetical protein
MESSYAPVARVKIGKLGWRIDVDEREETPPLDPGSKTVTRGTRLGLTEHQQGSTHRS